MHEETLPWRRLVDFIGNLVALFCIVPGFYYGLHLPAELAVQNNHPVTSGKDLATYIVDQQMLLVTLGTAIGLGFILWGMYCRYTCQYIARHAHCPKHRHQPTSNTTHCDFRRRRNRIGQFALLLAGYSVTGAMFGMMSVVLVYRMTS